MKHLNQLLKEIDQKMNHLIRSKTEILSDAYTQSTLAHIEGKISALIEMKKRIEELKKELL